MNAALPELGWIDWTLLAVLAASVAVGLWRGLVFELMALAGWIVAYVLAQAFASEAAARLPVGSPGSALNHGAGFAAVFVGVLLVWALLAFTPAARSTDWAASRGANWLNAVLHGMRPMLPADVSRHLPA